MPRMSAASPFSTFAFHPPNPVPPPFIPIGSLVIYNGSYTGITGWTQYAPANGLFIKGTATDSLIGTTTTPSLSGTCSVSLGTAGSHFPSQISFGPAYNPSGTAQPGGWFNLGTAGAHIHTLGDLDLSTIAIPNPSAFSTYTIIQSTTLTKRLPANCIVFSQNAPGSLFSLINAENQPIRGGVANNNTGTGTPTSNIRTTAIGGTHSHIDNTYPYNPATVQSTNYPYVTTVAHNHNLTLTIAARSIYTKLLSAWGSNAETYLGRNTILMYSGSLSNLPQGWYVCDGNNGTINMVDFFIGFGSQMAWNTTTGQPNDITATGVTTTNSWNHNHEGSGIAGATPATLASVPHGTFSASHFHTVTPTITNAVYDPGSIKIAFIQYIGY